MSIRIPKLLILFLILCIFISCTSLSKSSQKTISINSIGWLIENIDPTYWSDYPLPATGFGVFIIRYVGDSIDINDIEYAQYKSKATGNTWKFTLDPEYFQIDSKRIFSNHNYISTHSKNGSSFPIGLFIFEIKLKNGYVATYEFYVPSPGQSSSNGKLFAVTEDFTDNPSDIITPMVKRPQNISYKKDISGITIFFSSNDPLLFNGQIQFYDSKNNFIGNSKYFCTYGIGKPNIIINDGQTFYTDGNQNRVHIEYNDISFNSNKSPSDIASFCIILTDGKQYMGSNSTYDCRAIGQKIIIN